MGGGVTEAFEPRYTVNLECFQLFRSLWPLRSIQWCHGSVQNGATPNDIFFLYLLFFLDAPLSSGKVYNQEKGIYGSGISSEEFKKRVSQKATK